MQVVLYLAVAALLALCALSGAPAFAEGATVPVAESWAINMRPLINEVVVPILAGLLGLLATWISTRLVGVLKLEHDDALRGIIENGMQKGIAYALSKLDDATKSMPLSFEVRSKIVADAANYVIGATPDALKKLGVTKDAIERAVAARLEIIVNPALPTPEL